MRRQTRGIPESFVPRAKSRNYQYRTHLRNVDLHNEGRGNAKVLFSCYDGMDGDEEVMGKGRKKLMEREEKGGADGKGGREKS